MRKPLQLLAVCLAASVAVPVSAEVTHSSDAGFATSDSVIVGATPQQVWARLIDPAQYWNPEHSWTLDSANFTLEPQAGGCFCEVIPANGGNGVGSVEHARVIYAAPGQMLRMRGSLGPLQSEALTGVLTVKLEGEGTATKITWEYVVSGFARYPLRDIAAAVDSVQTEQLKRLAALFPSHLEYVK